MRDHEGSRPQHPIACIDGPVKQRAQGFWDLPRTGQIAVENMARHDPVVMHCFANPSMGIAARSRAMEQAIGRIMDDPERLKAALETPQPQAHTSSRMQRLLGDQVPRNTDQPPPHMTARMQRLLSRGEPVADGRKR